MSEIRLILLIPTSMHAFSIYRKSSVTCEQLSFKENKIKFYFQNYLKSPFLIDKSEVAIEMQEEIIVFTNLKTSKLIGKVYKNLIDESSNLNELLKLLDEKNKFDK